MILNPLSITIIVFGGVCWMLVYIEGIRLGLRDRSYAIPFWALVLNLAWELVNAIGEYWFFGSVLLTWIIILWLVLDLGILYTYIRFGRQESPVALGANWFWPWLVLALVVGLIVQLAFIDTFGFLVGRTYAAFLQNLLMSVLFIVMLANRGHHGGQSLVIAVSKWLGTLAFTILFGVIGEAGTFATPSRFILMLGLLCAVFDVLYIVLLWRMKVQKLTPSSSTLPQSVNNL
jgi:hypothetical protein